MRKDLPNPGILDLNPDPNLPTDVPHGVTLAPDHGHDLTPEDTSVTGQEADPIIETAIQDPGPAAVITKGLDTQEVEAGGGPLTTETTTAGRVAAVVTGVAADPRGTAGDGEERKRHPCPTDADILEIEITLNQPNVWEFLV